MAPIFELRDVCFEYDRIPALRDLSLQIAPGESVALLGANGSGKSTLLRILDALYFPARGQASFSGQPLTADVLQQEEFAAEAHGYTAVKHQHEVGTGYFDEISQVVSGGTSSTTALKESTETSQFA